MTGPDNFHSYLVTWAKIVLPLSALALLSTLFLFAKNPAKQSDVPYAEIEQLAREQQITAPRFSGVTDDGSVFSISARSARPDMALPDTVSVDGITLKIGHVDGSEVTVNATTGTIDGRAKLAQFLGIARLTTSSGYEMETNGLSADLQSGLVTSNGLLEVRAPFGTLTAGQVTFRVSDENTGQQMLFSNGVRLLYTPVN